MYTIFLSDICFIYNWNH